MKKTLSAILTVLTMVCVFALSASAYEHKYFRVEVPSEYTVSEFGDTQVEFEKENEIEISVNIYENDYTDFYNMSEAERDEMKKMVQEEYSSVGTISDFECTFDGDGVSKSRMYYTFEISNPDDSSEYYYVEGVAYSEAGVLYHIMFLYTENVDTNAVKSFSNSFEFLPDGSGMPSEGNNPQSIYYVSDDGVFSLVIPSDFAPTDAPAPIDGMWMTEDGGAYAISTLVTDNLLHEKLANLDAAGREKVKSDVVTGANNSMTNTSVESVTVGGKEGLHIYGDYNSSGTSATMEIYMFSTYDKLYAVYFYDFGDANAETHKTAVLNTLRIDGEILGAEEATQPSTQPSAQPSTQPSTQPTNPTVPAVVTTETDEETKEDDKDDKSDKDNTTLYIIIGAVVVIALIAIIAIVILGNNKKKGIQNVAPQYVQNYNPQQYQNNYPQNNYSQNPPMNYNNNNDGFNQNNNF